MAYSPRKIPLSAGDSLAVSAGPKTIRRAFFCSVVVENVDKGRSLRPEGMSPEAERVENLLASLGVPLAPHEASMSFIVPRSSSAPAASSMNLAAIAQERPAARRRSMTNGTALQDTLKELITTERSYVNRLRILKKDYADQLRTFAKRNDSAIIPMYEANTLFGNVDALLLANEAFLRDLETMVYQNGYIGAERIGDIALKHFRDLRTFDCYRQYYAKREEAQKIFEALVLKNKAFAHFIETVKYSAAESRNRVGLRELLMDPIQRIPRYTMMFRSMLDKMDPSDHQRAKLNEACDFANKVALCEADDPTKRAAIMYRLERSIEGFPPGLISSNRRFIDCIDVEDVLNESLSQSSSGSSGYQSSSSGPAVNLPCTLFLFDDAMMIVKRPSSTPGKVLAGLDDAEKATQMPLAGGKNKVKPQMSCKGVLDILDVVGTDPGGPLMHMFLEKPPHDQTDRWAGRPFRSYAVALPPAPIGYDPLTTQDRKQCFLHNLWTCQAEYRTRQGRSNVRYMPERELDTSRGKTTFARTYFNVYQRTAYLSEPKKGKIILHIDPKDPPADDLPFGVDGGPYVNIRVQPMEGELCRWRVTTRDPAELEEEDIIETAEVPERVVNTIQAYRLFNFHTGIDSTPATPHHGGTARSRTGLFGLDSVSRNLFNSRPGSVMGDVFGTINGHHKRTKSNASKVSTLTATTTTTTTGTGSFKFSSSRSTSTAQSSLMDEDDSSSSSPARRRSTIKRPISQISSPEMRSPPKRKAIQMEMEEAEEPAIDTHVGERPHDSGWELNMRLELARNNSQKQEAVTAPRDRPTFPSTISEESWQNADTTVRGAFSPRGQRAISIRSSSTSDSRPRSTTPTQAPSRAGTPQPARARRLSRPSGPRLSANSPRPSTIVLPAEDSEPENIAVEAMVEVEVQPIELEDMLADMTAATIQPPKLTQSDDGTAVATPPRKVLGPADINTPKSVEPLSIIKKTSVKKASPSPNRQISLDSPTRARAAQRTQSLEGSPKSGLPQRRQSADPSSKTGATRHGSQQDRGTRRSSKLRHRKVDDVLEANQLLVIAETTREDMNSSRRALKKIKLEVDAFKGGLAKQLAPKDPVNLVKESGIPRSPKAVHISNQFREERMMEMRQLLEQGGRGVSARAAAFDNAVKSLEPASKPGIDFTFVEEWSKNVEGLLIETDAGLKKAVGQQEDLRSKLKIVLTDAGGKAAEVDKLKADVEHLKKQTGVLKKFLDDATTEKEVMYEAFNEELDGMFNDVSLPEGEAWQAMAKDLQKAKDARNQLSMQNMKLKRELEETKLQNEHYETLLRKAGLL